MKQDEKDKEVVQENTSQDTTVSVKKEVAPVKEEVKPTVAPANSKELEGLRKELEELRQYKSKVEEDKKKDVIVSDTFFGKEQGVVKQKVQKKYNEF